MHDACRVSDWENRLSKYLISIAHKEFSYGEFDCCMFANGAVEALTGVGAMEEFVGKYDDLRSSIRALREIGAGDLEKTLDSKFKTIPIGFAQRGDLAFFADCVGVILGDKAAFVTDEGFETVEREYWQKCWMVGRNG